MKPTITLDRPKAPTIRMAPGARNAIVPARSAQPLANRSAEVIKIPAGERAAGMVSGVLGALGSLVPSFGLNIQGGDKTDNRQIDNSRHDNRQQTFNDNRQAYNTDNRTFVDQDNLALVDHDEANYTQVSDSHNQNYSVQGYSSQAYTDASQTNVAIDNSQHYTDASTTNIHNDNSQHYTDQSRHVNMAFAQASTGQSMMLGLFFGDGLEKVLLALVMLGIVITIFFTELLMLAGGLAAFIIVYKTAKFAWQRSEVDKQRKHELELARLNNRPIINIHVANAEVFAQVAAQVGVNIPQAQQPQAKAKQPEALPEPSYFEPQAPTAVSPTRTQKAKEMAGKAAGKVGEAARKHAKQQTNIFIDGMKHEVWGVKRK